MLKRETCPLCDGDAEVVFSRPYRLPVFDHWIQQPQLRRTFLHKEYEIRFCPPCDFHFQTWVMDDAELSLCYRTTDDGAILDEIARYKLRSFAHHTEEILVFRQVCKTPRPSVLDFGSGWGAWSSMALAHGCDVYAVEVNERAAKFCAARGITMITLADVSTHRFDFISFGQVIEHLSEPLAVSRALAAALKPGGLMKISTPGPKDLPRQLRRGQATGDDDVLGPSAFDGLAPLAHVNLFSNQTLKLLATKLVLDVYRPPLWTWLGAGQMWNVPRQLNRNLTVPFKRRRQQGTYLWYVRND